MSSVSGNRAGPERSGRDSHALHQPPVNPPPETEKIVEDRKELESVQRLEPAEREGGAPDPASGEREPDEVVGGRRNRARRRRSRLGIVPLHAEVGGVIPPASPPRRIRRSRPSRFRSMLVLDRGACRASSSARESIVSYPAYPARWRRSAIAQRSRISGDTGATLSGGRSAGVRRRSSSSSRCRAGFDGEPGTDIT